jgi:glycine betaine transporter
MFKNPLLLTALAMTLFVAGWGIFDTAGLAGLAAGIVAVVFQSRGWFIMLTASTLLLVSIWLAFSRYGKLRLGREDERPEFATGTWLAMMFAAGMGVGLLFYGAAEPATHYFLLEKELEPRLAPSLALFITNFHWGLHAWAIYGLTSLVIAYFGFRKGTPQLVSAPIIAVFGKNGWTRATGWLVDLLAIYAIAIGLAGSVAMGVFQVQDGVVALFSLDSPGMTLTMGIFVLLCIAFILPLMVDLSRGMGLLSNAALLIAIGLMVYLLLVGPTYFLMNNIVEAIGTYAAGVWLQGFRTYTFFEQDTTQWFGAWTLNYMVWWLAWAPFVGVFIARISRGRTIKEFLIGVLLAPTVFSIFWFGIFGGLAFSQGAAGALDAQAVAENINQTTFLLLNTLPLSAITTAAVVVAAFLFIVTSVVSAAFVLAMFSTGGDSSPPVKVKLIWGVILGLLGLAMILSNSVDAVRQIIALSAGPFVFIVVLLMVCLLKALKKEK